MYDDHIQTSAHPLFFTRVLTTPFVCRIVILSAEQSVLATEAAGKNWTQILCQYPLYYIPKFFDIIKLKKIIIGVCVI